MIDLDALLHPAILGAFAESVRVLRASGASFEVRGVFDSRHFEAEMSEGPPMSLERVTLFIRLSELPAGITLRAGDRVIRAGVTYQVIAPPQPDSVGGVLLILGAVQP